MPNEQDKDLGGTSYIPNVPHEMHPDELARLKEAGMYESYAVPAEKAVLRWYKANAPDKVAAQEEKVASVEAKHDKAEATHAAELAAEHAKVEAEAAGASPKEIAAAAKEAKTEALDKAAPTDAPSAAKNTETGKKEG